MTDKTYYDEGTLEKVVGALMSVGIMRSHATDAVSAMQNAGILFRERLTR